MSKLDEVLCQAQGHWGTLFATLAPQLKPAMDRVPKHVPCPVHGGKDGFRLFKDYSLHGNGICNTCGGRRHGIHMLMWVNDWTFSEALEAVEEALALENIGTSSKNTQPSHYEGVLINKGYSKLRYGVRYCVTLQDAKGVRHHIVGVNLKDQLHSIEKGTWIKIRFKGYEPIEGSKLKKRRYEVEALGDPKKQAIRLQTLWDKGLEKSDRIKAYLASRHITLDEPLPLREGKHQGLATLLAPIKNLKGHLLSLHCTYLSSTDPGKADIDTPKRVLKLPAGVTITGAAIPLFPPERGVLALTEGIETALSVRQATGLPVWACISANGLKSVVLPNSVKVVFIFADHDASHVGQEAALQLRSRLEDEGRLVFILKPPHEGDDWNDVLSRDGEAGFPLQHTSEAFHQPKE